MTRPTAPILTADYYTYSTYSQQDDFYGGFEARNGSVNTGPTRMEPIICKNQSRKIVKEDTASAHCITFIYFALAMIVIAFNCYIYYYGIRNKMVFYITALMGFIVFTSLLMHVGIVRRHPFLCIPFVVCRTMEAFICICFMCVFGYSLFDRKNDFYIFFLECTKFVAQFLPKHYNIDLADATLQLCIVGFVLSLLLLSISVYVCRVSFECTTWVADQFRAKRIQQSYDSSRARIASDEFYCT
ncbi:unnamed protein product [Caenorhabditis bovis]|uniref:Uncharacterized protein n=1 Tax=Caenorhabditis bovis TaxID=2654633 RepID=A0A8S1E7A4_9PELO|nr:unnamed protein product [Caenorhabditis bovis]